MSDRFYVPQITRLSPGQTIEVDGSEAHHLVNVLRARLGETVEVFDGSGTIASAVITKIGRRSAVLCLGETRFEPKDAVSIHLLVAAPKGDRMRWLVEKATEVGVSHLTWVPTQRGQKPPETAKQSKLRQTMIAAAKQSRRSWLMSLKSATDWTSALEVAGQFENANLASEHASGEENVAAPLRVQCLADPAGRPLRSLLADFLRNDPDHRRSQQGRHQEQRQQQSLKSATENSFASGAKPGGAAENVGQSTNVVLAIGPEGGLTTAEIEVAKTRGFQTVSLGDTILRIETAAITLAATLRFWLQVDQVVQDGEAASTVPPGQ